MTTQTIGKNTIISYDSAENLPIRRYQKHNKHLMIAMGVGESLADFDKREAKSIEFLKGGMRSDAIKEMQNKRQCFLNAINEYSPSNNATAFLIHSINGHKYEGYDDSVINQIIDDLDKAGFTKQDSIKMLTTVKKKLMPNLDYISLASFLILTFLVVLISWKSVGLIWALLLG